MNEIDPELSRFKYGCHYRRDSKDEIVKIDTLPRLHPEVTSNDVPTSWSDPDYIATVVGVLAAGALCFYTAMTDIDITTEQVVFVLLAVLLPVTISREAARRWFF